MKGVLRAWGLALMFVAAWLGFARPARAHEYAPAVLALKQTGTGQYVAVWTPPFPPVAGLTVHLPKPCTIGGRTSFESAKAPLIATPMDCAGADMAGEIVFEAGSVALGPIAVNIGWLDGTQTMHLSRGTPATVALGGTAGAGDGWEVFRDYTVLGVEHILFGVDHVLFVLGLLLLVNGRRALLVTISAFTLAHSITLAAAALGFVDVPTGPVEICIALSILLLAFEVARQRESVTRMRPWLVAFGFGLLHGLGFASALSDVGLPRHALAISLLAFNLGVELGQLGIVGVAFGFFVMLRRSELALRWSKWAAVGVLTSSSVFWLLQRVESWLQGFGASPL